VVVGLLPTPLPVKARNYAIIIVLDIVLDIGYHRVMGEGGNMNPTEIVGEAIATHGRPLWVAHVPTNIREKVDPRWLASQLATAHRSPDTITRQDQYGDILNWCKHNLFAEVTLTQLQELSGLSAPTVRKFIESRMDVFRKLRRGVWEVRDPKADREADQR
jgi:hypothetical protein